MSSAILYLAIVAIWAVVLVPRWLRPRAAQRAPVAAPVAVPAEAGDAGPREPVGPVHEGVPAQPTGAGPVTPGAPAPGEAAVDASAEGLPGAAGKRPADTAPTPEEASADAPAPDLAPAPADRRAEVLRARRRLLTTLVSLTIIAVACAVTRIDAYWIIIPPAVLLAGYLVMLRRFAHFDAERARRAARIRRAAGRAGAAQEPAPSRESLPEAHPASGPGPDPETDTAGTATGAAPGAARGAAHGTAPGAEIIDISGRITDQVYDQYSDAANRAVGD